MAFPTRPTGLTGVQDYPNLFAELIRRGWSDENLAKLAGGNVLRVLAPGRSRGGVDEERARRSVAGRRGARPVSEPPLRAAIIPVTPLQQNCSLIWCTETMRGAFVDPGGDLPKLKAAAAAGRRDDREDPRSPTAISTIAARPGFSPRSSASPIEGPHEDDLFWIARLARGRPALRRRPAGRSSPTAGWSTATR